MIFCYASEFGNSIEDHFQVVLSPLDPNFTYNLPPWAWYDIPAVEKPAFPGSIAWTSPVADEHSIDVRAELSGAM